MKKDCTVVSVSPPSPVHLVPPLVIGVDVAKAELVIASAGQTQTVTNTQAALRTWLRPLVRGCSIGMESTNCYHQLLADLAHADGHTVYIINPKQIKHYRNALSKRAKTDLCDAVLIARFLEQEHSQLHPYKPVSPQVRNLNGLVHRRATVVKSQTQMRLSLEQQGQQLGIKQPVKATLRQFTLLLEAIDNQIEELIQHPELQKKASRLRSIVGLGPLTTAALLATLEHGDFKSADALVAFVGLDPKANDSGQRNGRRRLSKQGDGELRRLLYNAARSACKSEAWKPFYKRYRERGLTGTQALCILARKILRVAWSLHKHQTYFSREKNLELCMKSPISC
mgnify:CR=1 FL=1